MRLVELASRFRLGVLKLHLFPVSRAYTDSVEVRLSTTPSPRRGPRAAWQAQATPRVDVAEVPVEPSSQQVMSVKSCFDQSLQSADAVHVGVDNLGVVRHVARLLDDCSLATPLELVTDGDLLILIHRMIDLRGRGTVRVTKVKGHAGEDRFCMVGFVSLIGLLTMLLMKQLTLVEGGLALLLLMPAVTCLVFVVVGILFFLICIGSLLLSLELLLIMMGLVALLLIFWSVLLVLCLGGGGLFMLFVTLLCFLVLRLFGLGCWSLCCFWC